MGLSSVPCSDTCVFSVPVTETCWPVNFMRSETFICEASSSTWTGLVLEKAHFFRPAVALNVMRPRVLGSRSALRRLGDEGSASTLVRKTFQSVPLTCRFEAESWPVRWGADIDPCTLPWKLAD